MSNSFVAASLRSLLKRVGKLEKELRPEISLYKSLFDGDIAGHLEANVVDLDTIIVKHTDTSADEPRKSVEISLVDMLAIPVCSAAGCAEPAANGPRQNSMMRTTLGHSQNCGPEFQATIFQLMAEQEAMLSVMDNVEEKSVEVPPFPFPSSQAAPLDVVESSENANGNNEVAQSEKEDVSITAALLSDREKDLVFERIDYLMDMYGPCDVVLDMLREYGALCEDPLETDQEIDLDVLQPHQLQQFIDFIFEKTHDGEDRGRKSEAYSELQGHWSKGSGNLDKDKVSNKGKCKSDKGNTDMGKGKCDKGSGKSGKGKGKLDDGNDKFSSGKRKGKGKMKFDTWRNG